MNFARFSIVAGGIFAIVILLFGVLFGGLTTTIDADKVAIVQFPTGSVKLWTEPGWHLKWFGKVTRYEKSNQYWFSASSDQGKKSDQSISTRFNDAGTAKISGGIRYDLPYTDEKAMMELHYRYGSAEAIEHNLIRTAVEKSILLSGPLRSSKEVFSTGQGRFLQDIEDQLINGTYKTYTDSVEVKDDLTGEIKTVYRERIVQDKNSPGGIARVDQSAVNQFGIKVYNFVINGIIPDPQVEKQISEQQKITMEVQTSIAKAKQAEQSALTAEKEGQANAAKAKWEQETIKIKEVTKAQQEKEVAETNAAKEKKVAETNAEKLKQVAILNAQAAEFYNKEQQLRAEADATYRKKMMESDGALQQKLDAYVRVNTLYAEAIQKHVGSWVPSIVMGQNGSQGNAALDLVGLLTAKTAQDLSLDLGTNQKKK